MKRITVIMSDETYNKIIVLGKQEKRKKSPMALLLIEDGLKLVEKNAFFKSIDNKLIGVIPNK